MWVMMRGGAAPSAVTDASAATLTASRGGSDDGQRPDVGERDARRERPASPDEA